MLISNPKVYDKLKFVAQILLPALGTLYFTLAGLWDLPAAEAVVGTIVAVDTVLGLLLQLSSHAYETSGEKYGGVIHVEDDGLKKTYSLVIEGDIETLEKRDDILFKVIPPQ